MSFLFSSADWSAPIDVQTSAGPRTVRRLKVANETAGHWWKIWRQDKERIKAARFSCSKDTQTNDWQATHWENEPGQFSADVQILDSILTGAVILDLKAEEESKIDFVAEDWEPLKTPEANLLFEWQKPSCQRIIAALKKGNAIDASQTGAGKTFVALIACKELGRTPYVVAPLAVLEGWRRAAARLGVRLGGVINYDKARAGTCEFIKKNRDAKSKEGLFTFAPPQRRGDLFENAADNAILILDECQKCKNKDSLQGRILIDSAAGGAKILLLSATAAKDPIEMFGLGLALGLHNGKNYLDWAKRHGCFSTAFGLKFSQKPEIQMDAMKRIHRQLFPAKGSRIRSADVPGYPDNAVTAHLVENSDIAAAYRAMENELELIAEKADAGKLTKNEAAECNFAAIMKARRASERGKLDFIVEETTDLLADGFQVVIFLNFREHLAIVRDALKLKNPPVWGTEWVGKKIELGPDGAPRIVDINGRAQKPEERQRIIDDFQGTATTAPKSRVILISLQAGGAGINLHDEHGHAPRQSLISPSYSVIDLIQSAGRIWRAESKTKATQRIIFAAKTIEEEIAVNLESKCSNLEHLNDGDLMGDSMAKVLANTESAPPVIL